MKSKRIAIVANGNIDWLEKSDLKEYSYVIGVDRAAYILLKLGVICDCAVGDFDSASKEECKEIEGRIFDVQRHPPEKDQYQTDLELAVSVALKQHPSEIVIFGGTGKRLDHEIAALHLLREIQKKKIQAILRDEHNEIRLIEGNHRIEKKNHFSYLSILPYSEEITISITGCKYPLHNHGMKKGTTLGVSNVVTSDCAEITIHEGIAFCIFSRDRK